VISLVKFSHIADCHLGAFGRNPVLREYNLKAFEKAVDISVKKDVDFIIIAGDLFHNPHPDMDVVNRAVRSLMKARRNGISIYSVYGSHDFNISRASLIDVLESADVFKKVVNYLDEKGSLKHVKDSSGVSIAGLSGRKNRMDVSYYQNIDFKEPKEGSIFVFHSPITEMKPADIHEEKTVPLSLLPEGYDYYAGGHIHRKLVDDKEGVPVVYPGPTFGSSYTDLEKDIHRGMFIIDDWEKEYVPINVAEIRREFIDAEEWTIDELEDELLELSGRKVEEDIVLLKVKGRLSEGFPEDIDFQRIRNRYEDNGAETIYLNRRNLEGKDTQRIKVKQEKEEELEERVLNEYTSPDNVPVQFAEDLLHVLKETQNDGETKSDYENRIWEESWHILQNIDDYRERAENEGAKSVDEEIDFSKDLDESCDRKENDEEDPSKSSLEQSSADEDVTSSQSSLEQTSADEDVTSSQSSLEQSSTDEDVTSSQSSLEQSSADESRKEERTDKDDEKEKEKEKEKEEKKTKKGQISLTDFGGDN